MAASGVWHSLNLGEKLSIPCLVLSKLVVVALPIAQITIGAKFLKDCTQQNYLPVYVLVCGVFSMSLILFSFLPCSQKDYPTLNCLCSIWNNLVSLFLFGWFIAGSVWIYSIYPPNYNSTMVGEPYCNKTLYLFAFWTTTLAYILFAVALVGITVYLICLCQKVKSDDVTQA